MQGFILQRLNPWNVFEHLENGIATRASGRRLAKYV
jgi:hypothetical protein